MTASALAVGALQSGGDMVGGDRDRGRHDDDAALLETFAATGSPQAFAGLVRRHVDLVYAAARRLVRDPHLAEDVTQAVFVVLSRKAAGVRPGALSAWLHTTTRYAAANALKVRGRRRRHERVAAARRPEVVMPALPTEPDPLLPMLDEAIGSLGEADRIAVVMRYLEGRDTDAVAAALGVSPEAARKRAERAVYRLQAWFVRHGRAVGVTAVMAALAVATEPAPAAVVGQAASAATVSGAVGPIPASIAQPLLAAPPVKLIAIAATAVAGVGVVGALILMASGPETTTVPKAAAPTVSTSVNYDSAGAR
jgi:RNA polymerase sigma factor (sigma-70 family)